jgi:hypothetical protein
MKCASFFKTILMTMFPRLQKPYDSCPGQNRNHTLIHFCMGLVESKRFDNIIQRFPIRGHSFLDCDRTFGLFKRRIKKVNRMYISSNGQCSPDSQCQIEHYRESRANQRHKKQPVARLQASANFLIS